MKARPAWLIIILLSLQCGALAAGPGATSANFLKIPVGARQTAAGAAFAAVADDPTAAYYNPAGLAQITVPEAVLSHNRYFEDITQQWFGAALPYAGGTFGLALNYLSVPPFPSYSAADARTGSVSSYDMAASLSYARAAELDNDSFKSLLYGVTARHVTEKLDSESAYGYGVDAGLLLKPYGAGVSLSAGMDNLYASEIKFIDEGFRQARTFKAGAAYRLPLRSGGEDVVSLCWSFPDDGPAYASAGAEFPVAGLFTLRGGYSTFGDVAQGFSLGFGVALPYPARGGVELDYSFSSTYDLGAIHKFGLLYRFGPAPAAARPARRPARPVERAEDPHDIPSAVYADVLGGGRKADKLAVIGELAGARWEKSSPLLLPLLDSKDPELRAAARAAVEKAAAAEPDPGTRARMRAALEGRPE